MQRVLNENERNAIDIDGDKLVKLRPNMRSMAKKTGHAEQMKLSSG
jgi:hypothetical protein